ncbi:MAG: flavodoxin-dependent (E)-4-hydroxy-3-methylbut-2-enyl-diphosphate synthase [Candidatus Peregrinibacteria bacterium]
MRRFSLPVSVGNCIVGGKHPILVQSMTNTDTADILATTNQILELAEAGSEMVRITVDTEESAKAVPHIVEAVRKISPVPIIGDFHFNGHLLLKKYPEMAQALDKYRVNPGNVGKGEKRDQNFEAFLSIAKEYEKPIRIGVNGGSLDPEILQQEMDAVSNSQTSDHDILASAMVKSALQSAQYAVNFGFPKDKIILSVKHSSVPVMLQAYRLLAAQCEYPLHIGLTEAGGGKKGLISSAIALGILLAEGIGDTIRVSITPRPKESRTEEVRIAQEILQSLQIRNFTPEVTSCPGCGRTNGNHFQEFSEKVSIKLEAVKPIWKEQYPLALSLKIAVMGCIVNGIGEAKDADIGIFFPGKGEGRYATVYVGGKREKELQGTEIFEDFWKIVENTVTHTTTITHLRTNKEAEGKPKK